MTQRDLFDPMFDPPGQADASQDTTPETARPGLFEDQPRAHYFAPIAVNLGKCEWCGVERAIKRLIGTACCGNCTTRPARLAAARARWDAGRAAMGR